MPRGETHTPLPDMAERKKNSYQRPRTGSVGNGNVPLSGQGIEVIGSREFFNGGKDGDKKIEIIVSWLGIGYTLKKKGLTTFR